MKSSKKQIIEFMNDPDVRLQTLQNCVTRAALKSGITEITFQTKDVGVSDAVSGDDTVGVVIWVPRKTFDIAVGEFAAKLRQGAAL